MKRTKYAVTYGRDVARFSNRADALRFAKMASALGSPWSADGGTEVRAPDGLIGQFDDSKPSAEFAHLDRA